MDRLVLQMFLVAHMYKLLGRHITCSMGPVDHMLVALMIIYPKGLVDHILVDIVDDKSNSYGVSQVLLAWWSTMFFCIFWWQHFHFLCG